MFRPIVYLKNSSETVQREGTAAEGIGEESWRTFPFMCSTDFTSHKFQLSMSTLTFLYEIQMYG